MRYQKSLQVEIISDLKAAIYVKSSIIYRFKSNRKRNKVSIRKYADL